MTIYESYSFLFKFFQKEDLFSLDKNFTDLLIINNYIEAQNKKILSFALNLMEKDGVVNKISKDEWVLVKKLTQIEQSIRISGDLALALAEIVNKYYQLSGNQTYTCNPLAVSQADIAALVIISENVLKMGKSE